MRKFLKKYNQSVFEKMKGGGQSTLFSKTSPEALKGDNLLLTEFDHLPEYYGTLPCFEVDGEFVQNESTFKENIITGIREVLKYSNNVKDNYGKVSDDLIGIVYELMKNTFEWAKDDRDRVPFDPSLRGLLIRFYKKRRKTLLDEYKTHAGLTNYFNSTYLKENVLNELYFLELSVFDSGEGFVEKYKSLNDVNDLNDVDIVKKCLIKHNTSAHGLEKDDKGIGLDRILTILDKKGFLRIKTGEVCVYRNMISHTYKRVINANFKQIKLLDWDSNDDTNYSKFRNARGTVVTIIYPLSTQNDNE